MTFESTSTLERIEAYAFAWTTLSDLIILGCVESFSGSALVPMTFQSFSFSGFLRRYCICDQFLQDISSRFLVRYFGNESCVHIGSSVELISESCFSWCRSPTFATFEAHSNLSCLAKEAFHASELCSIHIPKSVEMIGESCFSWCSSLEPLTFETNSRVTRMERETFRGSDLRSIEIPGSVEVICELCFSCCYSLASVRFEENAKLVILEKEAFCGSDLQAINIPRSVELIGELCFRDCNSLASVTFDPESKIRAALSDLRAGLRFDSRSEAIQDG
jgi:hypothetical protein